MTEKETNSKRFKILSIDGGGIRGIIPCKILAELETELIRKEGPEARLCDYFDLICGTSTGGIIAIGLALGLKASDILELYVEHGKEIFPSTRRNKLHKGICFVRNFPFYERGTLKRLLKDVYNKVTIDKDTRIGHARTRLLVPVYNSEHGTIHIFKTAHHSGLVNDYQIPAVDVALATSAAPVYFEPYSFTYTVKGTCVEKTYRNIIDGGIVANNPSYLGLTEAMAGLNMPLKDISLLSLGTGIDYFAKNISSSKMGAGFWANPINKNGLQIYEMLAAAQAENIDNNIKILNNGIANTCENSLEYLRIQHYFGTGESIGLDDASDEAIERMNSIAQQLYRRNGVNVEKLFLNEKVDKFEPFKTL